VIEVEPVKAVSEVHEAFLLEGFTSSLFADNP